MPPENVPGDAPNAHQPLLLGMITLATGIPMLAWARPSTQLHGIQHGSMTLVLLWSSLVVSVLVVVVSLVVVTSVVVVVAQWSCHWASSYQWWFGGESLS